MTLRTVVVNGAPLTYLDAGSGDPVLFVHGSLDDYRSWRLQVEPFAAHYRVIAYSRRYHYPNPWTGDGSDYSAELHAADLAAIIRGLELGPVHLVTSSYGGNVGLSMTSRHPTLVRSIVLGEPPLLPLLETIPGGAVLWEAFVTGVWLPAREAFEQDDLEEGARRFLDGVMGRPTLQHIGPRAYRMIMDNAPEMKAETLSIRYFPPFTCEDAGRLALPALFCKGALSPHLFHLISDRLASCIPGAEVVTVPGASHAMHIGNPQFYNDTVLAFLKQLAA